MIDQNVYKQKRGFYFTLSSTARGAIFFALLVGVGSFVAGMISGQYTRTWGGFLFNLIYFFSLALGGVAFGNMQDIVSATWARPVKRLHESFGSFLPVASAMLVFFFVCIKAKWLHADQVYSWIADPSILIHFHGKDVWLQENFMLIRDIFALAVILWLVRWHLRKSTEADTILLQEDNQEKALAVAIETNHQLRYWSAPILVVYSLAFSLLVFDLTMSLAPTWFSTLWGGWSFAIMMQTLMASMLLFMFATRNTTLGQFVGRQQFHDIGKLLFGFTVFFAYLTYAHILTYWYTNMPEETSYFHTRLNSPWCYLLWLVGFGAFIFPFFSLIPKASKWTTWVAIPVSLVVLITQWVTYMLVVMPEVLKDQGLFFPWIEMGLMFGFLGLFFFVFFRYSEKTPMISLADPLLTESLHGHH